MINSDFYGLPEKLQTTPIRPSVMGGLDSFVSIFRELPEDGTALA